MLFLSGIQRPIFNWGECERHRIGWLSTVCEELSGNTGGASGSHTAIVHISREVGSSLMLAGDLRVL